jgi:eukaryotic-like serine/threonine-protein kinase
MSPEQVKGRPADTRSDIFSFGAILYEMLSGKRAFHRDSAAETMSAILKEEPPDLSATNQNIHPGLERIVRHCLEKSAEERFHSAHDLAFDLEAVSGISTPRALSAALAPAAKSRHVLPWLAAATALAAAFAGVYLAGKKAGHVAPPSFRQLTFRRGPVWSARFAADGKTVLYSASWDGRPIEIYLNSPESPESRPLGLAGADVLAVSPTGEAAVALNSVSGGPFTRIGTLARTSVTGGGAPREVLEGVLFADWSPDGRELAAVRNVSGRARLELPIGKVVYENAGWIGHPRVSPKGDRVAFVDHPIGGDDGGPIAVVDRAGKKTTVSSAFASARGLAWSPDGSEVWFTAADVGGNRGLWAVAPKPSGRPRLLARVTGSLTLQDVSRDGRTLMSHDTEQIGFLGLAPGESKERDLSWLDYSSPSDLSADGKTVLFFESGEGGGAGYSVYTRKTDGSPAVRLGEGAAQGLSPDGKWALAIVRNTADAQLVLYPTGAGEPKTFPADGLKVRQARFLPDGRRILMGAVEEGHGIRIYVRDLEGGKPRALTPERYRQISAISPDGKRVALRGPDDRFYIYPIDGGEPAPIPGLGPDDAPIGWTGEERFVYVRRGGAGHPAARIERLDVATGHAESWKTLTPSDTTGLISIGRILITADGRSYVYGWSHIFSDLFLVEGLK